MKKTASIFLLTILATLSSVADSESATEYFAVFIDGQKAGHGTHVRTVSDGKVTTTDVLTLSMLRGAMPISLSVSETCIETEDGQPLGFESIQDFGLMKIQVKGRVNKENKIEITSTSGGQPQTRVIDLPKDALMSEGLRLAQLKRGLKAGTTWSAKVFSPSMMTVIDVEITVGSTENVDLLGRVVPLTKIDTIIHSPTGSVTSTSYVDKNLNALKSVMPMVGMKIEMISCTKKFALSDNDLVDILDKCLLQSPVALTGLSDAESVSYKLVAKDNAQFHVPATDNQKVQADPSGAIIVTVKPTKMPTEVRLPYKGNDAMLREALEPTMYVQSQSKEIIALAEQAVGNTKNAAVAAKKIEKFVNNYIEEKHFGIGYASAVDVAQSRQGDCTEHAVLTAAMCRSIGIPAQIATGVLYVENFGDLQNVFGGHAWVQAYIGDRWVYLDATRPDSYKFGYIAFAVGTGDPESFFDLVTSLGNFRIEEIKINH